MKLPERDSPQPRLSSEGIEKHNRKVLAKKKAEVIKYVGRTRGAKERPYPKHRKPPKSERADKVLAFLIEHPGETVKTRDMLKACGMTRGADITHWIRKFVRQKLITKLKQGVYRVRGLPKRKQ